ncbi:MAG: hypothetical protein ACYCW6_05530 [Candidatus Xenobia bacterium]
MENRICLFPDLLVLLAAGLILLGSVGPWAMIDAVETHAHMVGGSSNVITGFSDNGGRPALLFIGVAGFMVLQLITLIAGFPRASIVTMTCSLLIVCCGLADIFMSVSFMRTFTEISHLSIHGGHAFPVHIGYGLRLLLTGGLLAVLGGAVEMAMRRRPLPAPPAAEEQSA